MKMKVMMRRIMIFVMTAMLLSMPAFGENADDTEAAKGEWRFILLLGQDSQTETGLERSDVNMVLCVNAAKNIVKLVSIMRDTWVKFAGRDKNGKLNACVVYDGPELTMNTVNETFGLNIEQYMLVNFDNVIDFVDLIGGVDIEITEAERKAINQNIDDLLVAKPNEANEHIEHDGLVHMNGMMALGYVRDRKSTDAGDFDRVIRQRNLAKAMVETIKKLDTGDVIRLAIGFLVNIKTNMPLSDILTLIPVAFSMNMNDIQECTIPFTGTFDSGIIDGEWKIVPQLDKNRELLNDFIYIHDE